MPPSPVNRKYEADEAMQQWVNGIFKKAVCRVDAQSFEKAKDEAYATYRICFS